jgi:uncharacterized membrane protein YdjX (TVP38/TMEM64 family)
MPSWLETYLQQLGHLGFTGGVLFAVTFGLLSLFGLPLVPFAIAAGMLFGLGGGLAGLVAGSTLGAALGFLISRYLARDRFARVLLKHPKFAPIDRAIAREGWKIVGLLRMCPIPFGLSNYCYGLTSVRFHHYLLATFFGMLPGETVFVYLGTAGKQMLHGDDSLNQSPAAKAVFYLGLIAAILVVFVLKNIVSKRLNLEETPAQSQADA